MSANNDEDKDSHKSVPLDLARNQITTVRSVEGKAPLVMSTQSLRNMRVLTQGIPSSGGQTISGPTIITTNIVPQAVLKQDPGRTQITNIINTGNQNSTGQSQGTTSITLQRPTQISLATTPVVAQNLQPGTTYHVPRGPAVVANLAVPRGNVTSVRGPMIVTAQSTGQVHSFVRPPRTPSPAQGTAWLNTNTSNGSQIKGAPTVLSSPVRGATVTGKPQLINRTQPSTQGVQTLRPTTAILHSAITIGQPGQIHSFKSSQGNTGIQTLNNTVTIAQVLPPRTQAIVYNPSSTNQFITASRLAVATSVQNPRQQVLRPTSARVAVPASQITSNRLINPQGAVLTPAGRIATQLTQTTSSVGSTTGRIPTTQSTVTINRLTVGNNTTQVTSGNNLGQARILHSLVAVANSQARNIQTSGAKVITQTAPGTIHLTPLTTPIKTTQSSTPTIPRTINVPAALVAQRPAGVVSTQAIPIVKAFSSENPQNSSVFIHAPVTSNVSHRATPSPTQTSTLVPATTVAYTLASGTYFYDASGTYSVARSFGQQSNNFATLSQTTQPVRPASVASQVHNLVTNQQQQQMRYNSVMVVDQGRCQQYTPQPNDFTQEQQSQQTLPIKATASPRPSILRKRDHEGSPLKAARNLNTVMATSLPQQLNQLPQSPISPRPDSRDNGNSSGGSTTISATSSPGLAEVNEDSMPPVPENHKEEEDVKPPMEMSPRKKPRKQQLTGNDIDEHNDDMQFICENSLKKEEESDAHSDEPRDGAPEARQVTTVRKPASASLLNSYRQTWKATHNHYLRYSDVKPKDERKPTIIDLANQCKVLEKVNGWKIYHLSTQMEDLVSTTKSQKADQEENLYFNLTDVLKCMEKEEEDKDVNRINELIKGNLQRIKIINDGIIDGKSQMMKVFDHQSQVTDIINRCASKRNFKKREKS